MRVSKPVSLKRSKHCNNLYNSLLLKCLTVYYPYIQLAYILDNLVAHQYSALILDPSLLLSGVIYFSHCLSKPIQVNFMLPKQKKHAREHAAGKINVCSSRNKKKILCGFIVRLCRRSQCSHSLDCCIDFQNYSITYVHRLNYGHKWSTHALTSNGPGYCIHSNSPCQRYNYCQYNYYFISPAAATAHWILACPS